MATTFYQLWNNLIGEVGKDLPAPRAKRLVNRAWRDVLNKRPWSFLLREGIIIAPAKILGNITFTQYTNTAVPSVALKAILDTLTSPPSITRRSLRLAANTGVTSPTSPIYDIYAYDDAGAGQLTLHRDYQEASGSQSVVIFRRWFLTPYDENQNETEDFLRWLTVKDPDSDWWLDLSKSKRWLDMYDPNRTASGTPTMLTEGPAATTIYPGVSFDGNLRPGTPLYELYPHYIADTQRTFQCIYQAYGREFTDDYGSVTSVLPPDIEDDLVMDRARMMAYRWAEINKGRIPSMLKTNWLQLMRDAKLDFDENFLRARSIDEERYKQNWLPKMSVPYRSGYFPGGADYWQTHSWPGLFGPI